MSKEQDQIRQLMDSLDDQIIRAEAQRRTNKLLEKEVETLQRKLAQQTQLTTKKLGHGSYMLKGALYWYFGAYHTLVQPMGSRPDPKYWSWALWQKWWGWRWFRVPRGKPFWFDVDGFELVSENVGFSLAALEVFIFIVVFLVLVVIDQGWLK